MTYIQPDTYDQIRKWIKEACDVNRVPWLAEQITFGFNDRFYRIWARADMPQKFIELSTLLWLACEEDDKRDTVIHEACHIIVWHKYGAEESIKNHGIEWKSCMLLANCMPSATAKIKIKV